MEQTPEVRLLTAILNTEEDLLLTAVPLVQEDDAPLGLTRRSEQLLRVSHSVNGFMFELIHNLLHLIETQKGALYVRTRRPGQLQSVAI